MTYVDDQHDFLSLLVPVLRYQSIIASVNAGISLTEALLVLASLPGMVSELQHHSIIPGISISARISISAGMVSQYKHHCQCKHHSISVTADITALILAMSSLYHAWHWQQGTVADISITIGIFV